MGLNSKAVGMLSTSLIQTTANDVKVMVRRW